MNEHAKIVVNEVVAKNCSVKNIERTMRTMGVPAVIRMEARDADYVVKNDEFSEKHDRIADKFKAVFGGNDFDLVVDKYGYSLDVTISVMTKKLREHKRKVTLQKEKPRRKEMRFANRFPIHSRPIVRELVSGYATTREICERFGVHADFVKALAAIVNDWGRGLDVTKRIASIREIKINTAAWQAA